MARPLIQLMAIAFLLTAAAAPAVESTSPQGVKNPWANYRFAPDALAEIDLASDTAWTLSVDGGASRPIKVTAGGWNSDQQGPQIASAAVKDYVVYQRKIEIPAEAGGNVVKLLFGGCNYGAEVWLDDRKVGEHHGPMTPFEVDLTAAAQPAGFHTLRVNAWHRFHYGTPPIVPAPFDFNAGVSKVWAGNTKFAYGLTGHVRLAVYPPIHVVDVFVRPSVSRKTLSADVWVANATRQPRTVTLSGALAAWGEGSWPYPAIPLQSIALAPGATVKVTVSVPWRLGGESYWWPNIPFREDYRAVLHWLTLTFSDGGKLLDRRRERFGFVEHAEGPYYYTVNGVRYTSFGDSNSYGQVGEYDCWTETPCFQPPHGDFLGCPETWRRYQRMGFNSMRLSTSVPTPYMLQTADEAGYMLNPEGGSWGNGTSRFNVEHFLPQLQETIRAVRNHPCVARYSLANESLPAAVSSPDNPWRRLIDAALEVDDTRPLVFEVNNRQTGAVPGIGRGHAQQMEHYMPIVPSGDRLRGMGECAWATNGMETFPLMAIQMRLNDWAHFAPWSWINFWPNFLEGMSHERHPWKANNHLDRHDAVDGWGSPIVKTVQRALDPYLVVDRTLLPPAPPMRGTSGGGGKTWLPRVPQYRSGDTVRHAIELFNGGLSGRVLELKWEARWDAPDGELLRAGRIGPVEVEAGFHVSRTVEFTLPRAVQPERSLFLVLESVKDGKTVYREDRKALEIR